MAIVLAALVVIYALTLSSLICYVRRGHAAAVAAQSQCQRTLVEEHWTRTSARYHRGITWELQFASGLGECQ